MWFDQPSVSTGQRWFVFGWCAIIDSLTGDYYVISRCEICRTADAQSFVLILDELCSHMKI